MTMKEGINLTMTEITKLNVIQSVIDHKRTGLEASEVLKITPRQVWRLVKKVKAGGFEGIKHGNKNRIPAHAISSDLKEKIITLKNSDKYCDANFTHFKELLEEKENIKISYSAIYNILSSNNISSKKKHSARRTHRRRKRKSAEGDLVQADGTPFDWFKDGNMYSIHGFIDDATGKILGLYMCEHECLLGYLEVTRQMLQNYGIPRCLYPDKYSVFFPAVGQKITVEEELQGKQKPTTQYMRIMNVLGINMFAASTSQAKGRIERLWNTLQDRLVTEFKINNVTTIETANIFLLKYIKIYNKKFSVSPESEVTKFAIVPNYIDLNLLLSSRLERVIDNAGTFTINNKRFQIVDNKILPRAKVDIYINKKNGIFVYHKDTKYKVICINNVPNSYSTLTLNQICNENSIEVQNYALELLQENAKAEIPILTSS